MDALIYWVGLVAVAVGALTGVLDSARKHMDLIGAVLVGTATALGGGTVRDILMSQRVFWVLDQTYLMVAIATSVISFFIARRRVIPVRMLLVPDAIGLALFTIIGTQYALHMHEPWLVASLMGVTTGVVGGVVRDILCNDVPGIFLHGELYATAAWIGALALIGLQELGMSPVMAAWIGMAIVLGLRLAAMAFHITMPAFTGQVEEKS